MRTVFITCTLLTLLVTSAKADERKERILTSWQQAQREVRSLVVEFRLRTKGPVRTEDVLAEGIFRLIRTARGDVFASYEIAPSGRNDSQPRVSGLLAQGKLYLLNHTNQTAIRFEPTQVDLFPFLARTFHPFVGLLDRKKAEQTHRLDVVEQTKGYTYLNVKPTSRSGTFRQGRLALLTETSTTIPKDMPRQIGYTDGIRQHTIDITSWRINASGGPRREEFIRPEDRPGWEVFDSPFRVKK